jgi:hypothetical protein
MKGITRLAFGRFCLTTTGVLIFSVAACFAEADPFSLSIHIEEKNIMALRPVVVNLDLTNTAKAPLTMVAYPPQEVYWIDVAGPDGQPVPLTEEGQAIIKNAAASLQRGTGHTGYVDTRGYLSFTLAPGGIHTELIEITHMFQMYTPGGYSIRIRRKVPQEVGTGEVTSNVLKFNITYNPIVEKYRFPIRPHPDK